MTCLPRLAACADRLAAARCRLRLASLCSHSCRLLPTAPQIFYLREEEEEDDEEEGEQLPFGKLEEAFSGDVQEGDTVTIAPGFDGQYKEVGCAPTVTLATRLLLVLPGRLYTAWPRSLTLLLLISLSRSLSRSPACTTRRARPFAWASPAPCTARRRARES